MEAKHDAADAFEADQLTYRTSDRVRSETQISALHSHSSPIYHLLRESRRPRLGPHVHHCLGRKLYSRRLSIKPRQRSLYEDSEASLRLRNELDILRYLRACVNRESRMLMAVTVPLLLSSRGFMDTNVSMWQDSEPDELSTGPIRSDRTTTPFGGQDRSQVTPRGLGSAAYEATASFTNTETPSLRLKRKRGISPYYDLPILNQNSTYRSPYIGGSEAESQAVQYENGLRTGRSRQSMSELLGQDEQYEGEGDYAQSPTAGRSLLERSLDGAERSQFITDDLVDDEKFVNAVQSVTGYGITNDREDLEEAIEEIEEGNELSSEVPDIGKEGSSSIAQSFIEEASLSDGHANIRATEDEEPDRSVEAELGVLNGSQDEQDSGDVDITRSSTGDSSLPVERASVPTPRSSRIHPKSTRSTLPKATQLPIQAKKGPFSSATAIPQNASSTRRPKQGNRNTSLRQQAVRNIRRSKGAQVLVYRLAATQHQSHGVGSGGEAEGDQDDEDELHSAPTFIRRPGVNAVDVLNQLCKELIETEIQSLEEQQQEHRQRRATKGGDREGGENDDDDDNGMGSGKGRAALRRKAKAIEAFGGELEERCFELTEALDANHALTIRLRQALNEKKTLRDELLRIRRERDQVALRTDEMRRRMHERSMRNTRQDELSRQIHDIELAVSRGKARVDQDAQRARQTAEKQQRHQATQKQKQKQKQKQSHDRRGRELLDETHQKYQGDKRVDEVAEEEEEEDVEEEEEEVGKGNMGFWLRRFAEEMISVDISCEYKEDEKTITTTERGEGEGEREIEGEGEGKGKMRHRKGGLLETIKEFNTFLERSLTIL